MIRRTGGNKYGAIPTTADGIRFPSKRESLRYLTLKILLKGGKIADLELQPTYPIMINGNHICLVKLDFRYRDLDTGMTIIEDSKGQDTPVSKIKRKLVQAQYGIEVVLV